MCLLGTDSDCGLLRHPDPLVRVVKIYSLLAPYLCVLPFQSCPLSFCHLLIKQPVFCLNLGAFFIWVFWELCVWVLGTCSFANLGAINTCHSYSPASAFPSGASTPRYDHSLSIHINLNIFIINLFFFFMDGFNQFGFLKPAERLLTPYQSSVMASCFCGANTLKQTVFSEVYLCN